MKVERCSIGAVCHLKALENVIAVQTLAMVWLLAYTDELLLLPQDWCRTVRN